MTFEVTYNLEEDLWLFWYVMHITDLEVNDPRLQLLEQFKKTCGGVDQFEHAGNSGHCFELLLLLAEAKIIEGYNKGGQRLALPLPKPLA